MDRLTENKIVLVVRTTRLDELLARFNTVGQARFYVEHLGADFSDYAREHETYKQAISKAESILRKLGRLHVVRRSFLPNYIFSTGDTIVVLGQDGLVANTIKYSSDCPVIGVNPDPERWDGVLLPFAVGELDKVVWEVFTGSRPIRIVTMAKAELTDGQVLHAVNDLFIGVKSHLSARYLIEAGGRQEQQSSSGVIVSTGLGSSGWFRSLITGSVAVASQALSTDLVPPLPGTFEWDADHLYFTVREPFPSKTSQASLVLGKITLTQPLILTSQMPEAGVIFSDGIESDFIEFNSGIRATITISEKKGRLVV